MRDSNIQVETSENSGKIIVGFAILVAMSFVFALVIFSIYLWHFDAGFSNEHGNWGAFGDYVGGILNPVFAFLALLALLSTIYIQSKEMKKSARELSISATALREQSQLLKVQTFESSFFQMIKLHSHIVEDLKKFFTGQDIKFIKGRAYFYLFFQSLKQTYDDKNSDGRDAVDTMREAYEREYALHENDVGHVFRGVYLVLDFVGGSDIDNKLRYMKIIQSQLSLYEQVMLFYHCLFGPCPSEFKLLMEEWGMFSNLNFDILIEGEVIKEMYHSAAFSE
ncbi:putative phage abortive infection protein [Microbulbifer sp. CnH-101-G]|uniref:putative phage abortive infection protein n=1 Tax=Microbulbifer sp. CnH-101-G TaxID=3243393 RepID=UPI0040395F21